MTAQTPGQATYEALQHIMEAIEEVGTGTDAEVAVAAGVALAIARHALAAQERPAPGGDERRALLDIIAEVEQLDEPGPAADWIRLLAEYGLGEGPHPGGAPDDAPEPQPAPELPVVTPAVVRPAWGDVLVLAVGEDFPAERARELQDLLAKLNQGITVTTVRGVSALRTWNPAGTTEGNRS